MGFTASHFKISPLKSPLRPPRCSLSATPSPPFDLRSYWTALITQIDRQLSDAIPVRYPPVIFESMRYSVLSQTAKRAPPVLCVAACELFGAPRAAALPTACALEMVHAASLIHDDLPCMDDSPSRRGSPSNHTVFGTDIAVLAGDALFPLAFHHLVSVTPSDLVPHDRLLRVVSEIARAVGSTGMAAGQFLEISSANRLGSTLDFVVEKKFGEMAECSAVCGGVLGGAGEEEVEKLRRYGRAVGVLYEVVEDIREGGEKNKKKASYVGIYGAERAREVAEELRKEAREVAEEFEQKYGDKVAPLYSFVDYAVERGFEIVGGGQGGGLA